MGLGVSLGNAVSGMAVTQDALAVLSRNVSNAGTPGYHRQSVGAVDTGNGYVRSTGVQRAFSESLETHYTRTAGDAGYASTMAAFLDRLQQTFGKPGSAGSLDGAYAGFENALGALATSPDEFATRAGAVSKAQALAETLNRFSEAVSGLRRDVDARVAGAAETLNRTLTGLSDINRKLSDGGGDGGSRASLLDQRDRLVASLSELVDIRVAYRGDDTVAITTGSGIGLIDIKASVFSISGRSAGQAGVLTLTSPSGVNLDVAGQAIVRSGQLAALLELRDGTLADTQAQLDHTASSLATALSSEEIGGEPVVYGGQTGFSLDLAEMRPGNTLTLSYRENGIERQVRVVRVDDPARLPMDSVAADGVRTIGLSFADGAAGVAAGLSLALGSGLAVSAGGPMLLRVLDDGAANTTDVLGLSGRRTVAALQGDGLALNIFVDGREGDFTGSREGRDQSVGFAARITINPAIAADNRLLVQQQPGNSLGDAARANYLIDRLNSFDFSGATGGFGFSGTVGDLVLQVVNRQGELAALADDANATQGLAKEALNQRLAADYGVTVDEEMARLMQLQTAYAANARVLSAVQALLDTLLGMGR